MNILSKILIILITFSIFLFLFFVTFLSGTNSNIEKMSYENKKIGTYELYQNDNIFSISEVLKDNNNKIFVNQINTSDKIIFSSGSIITKNSSGTTVITITPGIYLFDLKETNSKYLIKSEGFIINNKGPGMFIINTLSSKENIVFSINSMLELELQNIKTNNKLTQVDLYPHMYLNFNLRYHVHDNYLINSDLKNISNKNTLGYFSEQIITKNNVSEKFLNLISLNNKNAKNTISNSLLLIKQELEDGINEINAFLKYTFGPLPGEKFINKYSILFINPKKKSIYYKNIIIRSIHELLLKDEQNKAKINLIIKNIKLIEKIDKSGSEEIKTLITFYYNSVLKSNKSQNIKINFTELLSKINNNKYKYNKKSLIYLENIFFQYDFENNKYLHNTIVQFRHQYFDDLNIDITGKNTKKVTINDIKNIDYFLLFIENILITSNISLGNIIPKDLITLFDDYITISDSYYLYNNPKIKRNGLFTNYEILNNITIILKQYYFSDKRNKNYLLKIKKGIEINQKEVSLLEDNNEKILEFYNKNKNILNSEIKKLDLELIKKYNKLSNQINEYMSALKNYKEYLVKYDMNKKELLFSNTVNEKEETFTLSVDNAKKYLKKFEGVNLDNVNIKIMDYSYCLYPLKENENNPIENQYCYKIDNLLIGGDIASFLLHPLEKNKIDEISINTRDKTWSYKLDEIELAMTGDKEENGFSNFLLNTFGKKIRYNDSNNNYNDSNKEELIEDSVIKIFKRNKLFGETGDFINIGTFLNVDYNDIIVKRINEKYFIDVKGFFTISNMKNNFYGEFSSKYNFNPNHSFINPKLKLIDKQYEKDLLLGNYIYIDGEYKINNIEEEIKELFDFEEEITFSIKHIAKSLKNKKIDILYDKNLKTITFKTIYNSKELYIQLLNGNIINYTYNGNKSIINNVYFKLLDTILNNIKK